MYCHGNMDTDKRFQNIVIDIDKSHLCMSHAQHLNLKSQKSLCFSLFASKQLTQQNYTHMYECITSYLKVVNSGEYKDGLAFEQIDSNHDAYWSVCT